MARFFRFRYDQEIQAGGAEPFLREVEDVRDLPPDVRRKPYQEEPGGVSMTGAGFAPPFRDGAGIASRSALYAQYPPHIYPPPDAFILDLPLVRSPATVIAAGGSADIITWQRVPQGQRGIVRKLAAVVTVGVLGDVRWTTRINGAPMQPFPGVRGAIGTIEAPQDTQLLLAPGDIFTLFAENTGAGVVNVLARSYGWFWTDERG